MVNGGPPHWVLHRKPLTMLVLTIRPQSILSTIRHSTFVIPHSKNEAMHRKAHRHLADSDPRLAALIARSRRYNFKPAVLVRPFDALAESIAYQQLSGKAAATIWGRVRALFPGKYLDPKAVVQLA